MIVNPKSKKLTLMFYNNLMFILAIFSLICLATYFNLENKVVSSSKSFYLEKGSMYGPIVVKKNKPVVCTLKAFMYDQNTSIYFTGEVLDEDKETLYEFGKELWHESGYDSEGPWTESDSRLQVNLSFTEPGKYYIQFNTDENYMGNVVFKIYTKKGSGIPHLMMGFCVLLLVYIFFIILNREWVSETLENINEWIEELADD